MYHRAIRAFDVCYVLNSGAKEHRRRSEPGHEWTRAVQQENHSINSSATAESMGEYRAVTPLPF
jgi:hypothetical protein